MNREEACRTECIRLLREQIGANHLADSSNNEQALDVHVNEACEAESKRNPDLSVRLDEMCAQAGRPSMPRADSQESRAHGTLQHSLRAAAGGAVALQFSLLLVPGYEFR